MSYRCKSKSNFDFDTLTKTLREVDRADYDHPLVGKVMYELAQMCEEDQMSIIKMACGRCKNYDELCGCVRKKFVLQKQRDKKGEFTALTYGKECVSVATWDGHKYPLHANEVNVTELCYKDGDGNLRCAPMLDFMELWMEQHKSSFKGFLSGLDTVNL